MSGPLPRALQEMVELDPRTTVTKVGAFDYNSLSAPTAAQLRSIAKSIRQRTQDAVLRTGFELISAKKLLPHGSFSSWVEAELEVTVRSAQRYMNAAELVQKHDRLSRLGAEAFYQLATPSTPTATRNAIIEHLQDGKVVSDTAIKDLIRRAKKKRPTCRGLGKQELAATAAVQFLKERLAPDDFERFIDLIRESDARFPDALLRDGS